MQTEQVTLLYRQLFVIAKALEEATGKLGTTECMVKIALNQDAMEPFVKVIDKARDVKPGDDPKIKNEELQALGEQEITLDLYMISKDDLAIEDYQLTRKLLPMIEMD